MNSSSIFLLFLVSPLSIFRKVDCTLYSVIFFLWEWSLLFLARLWLNCFYLFGNILSDSFLYSFCQSWENISIISELLVHYIFSFLVFSFSRFIIYFIFVSNWYQNICCYPWFAFCFNFLFSTRFCFFKKYYFKKHEAQNAETLRNI